MKVTDQQLETLNRISAELHLQDRSDDENPDDSHYAACIVEYGPLKLTYKFGRAQLDEPLVGHSVSISMVGTSAVIRLDDGSNFNKVNDPSSIQAALDEEHTPRFAALTYFNKVAQKAAPQWQL